MKTVGLFEAKTKLSEICHDVQQNREPVLITKRGEPYVKIEPLEMESSSSVWEDAAAYRKVTRMKDDFKLSVRDQSTGRDEVEF